VDENISPAAKVITAHLALEVERRVDLCLRRHFEEGANRCAYGPAGLPSPVLGREPPEVTEIFGAVRNGFGLLERA